MRLYVRLFLRLFAQLFSQLIVNMNTILAARATINCDYERYFSSALNRVLSCMPVTACLTARLAADGNFKNSLPLSFARLSQRLGLDCVVVM